MKNKTGLEFFFSEAQVWASEDVHFSNLFVIFGQF